MRLTGRKNYFLTGALTAFFGAVALGAAIAFCVTGAVAAGAAFNAVR